MTFWARSLEFHRLGSSAAAFSSSSRFLARSQSKMPPQQADRLLDFIDPELDFRTHVKGFPAMLALPRFLSRGSRRCKPGGVM